MTDAIRTAEEMRKAAARVCAAHAEKAGLLHLDSSAHRLDEQKILALPIAPPPDREALEQTARHLTGILTGRWEPHPEVVAALAAQAAEIERLTRERDEAIGYLNEIIEDCHNAGLPNEIVVDRVIERVEGWAMEARAALRGDAG